MFKNIKSIIINLLQTFFFLLIIDKKKREIYLTPALPGCGHMVAASEATCCSVYKASIFLPVMAFLSLLPKVMYMGLSLPSVYV